MKRLHLVFLITIISSCTNKIQEQDIKSGSNESSPFELIITDSDYSMAYGLQYILTEKNLNVVFKGGLEGEKDSVVFTKDFRPDKKIQMLSSLNLDSLQEYYENPCILDGSQITVNFQKDHKTKTIHLSNYYQSDVGLAIEQINKLAPKKYEIWYDKESLLQDQNDCTEGMKN